MSDDQENLFDEDGNDLLDNFDRLTHSLFERVSEFAEDEEIDDDLEDAGELGFGGDPSEDVLVWNWLSQATRDWLFTMRLVGVHEADDKVIAADVSRALLALLVVLKCGE